MPATRIENDTLALLLNERLACAQALDLRQDAQDLKAEASRIDAAIAQHLFGVGGSSGEIGASLLDAPRLAVMASAMASSSGALQTWGISSVSTVTTEGAAQTGGNSAMVTVQSLLRAQHQQIPVQLGTKALQATKLSVLRQ
jgi:hypothetical protein